MNEYSICHSCGHPGVIRVGSKGWQTAEEKKLIAMEEKRVCPSCYQATCCAKIQKVADKLPKFSGSISQQKFATDILQRLLAGLSSLEVLEALLAQDVLDPRPLLDAWQSIGHRDVLTPAGPRKWQYLVLRNAYPSFVKALPPTPREAYSDPGDVQNNIKRVRTNLIDV